VRDINDETFRDLIVITDIMECLKFTLLGALTVVDVQSVYRCAIGKRMRKRHTTIHSSGEEHDSTLHHFDVFVPD
jgi:hypothetical protein